jgi:hypothetical protein
MTLVELGDTKLWPDFQCITMSLHSRPEPRNSGFNDNIKLLVHSRQGLLYNSSHQSLLMAAFPFGFF